MCHLSKFLRLRGYVGILEKGKKRLFLGFRVYTTMNPRRVDARLDNKDPQAQKSPVRSFCTKGVDAV